MKSVIVFVVDDYIVQAEVESRGLVPTEDQARAFMGPHQGGVHRRIRPGLPRRHRTDGPGGG